MGMTGFFEAYIFVKYSCTPTAAGLDGRGTKKIVVRKKERKRKSRYI